MTAPAPQTLSFGWYRSGAGTGSVPVAPSRGMADSAWSITSRIISGLLLYTGLGWLISRWVGHQSLLMAVGALVGLALAYVLVFRGLARDARAEQGTAESRLGPAGEA